MSARRRLSYEEALPGMIDFIKVVAIIKIFSWHYFGYIQSNYKVEVYRSSPGHFINLISRGELDLRGLIEAGFAAVFTSFDGNMLQLFIFASGFGLYLSHLRNPRPWRAFYLRRAVRILPLYWLALSITYYLFREAAPVEAFYAHLMLVQNFSAYPLAFGALWFVGYIIQFYAVFPLMVFLFGKSGRKWFLFAGIALVSYLFSLMLAQSGWLHGVKHIFINHLPLFALGMVVADDYHFGKGVLRSIGNNPMWFAVSLIGLVLISHLSLSSKLLQASMVLVAVMLAEVYWMFSGSRWFRRVVGFLAAGSYVLFLVHMPIYIEALDILNRQGLIRHFPDGRGGMAFATFGDMFAWWFVIFIVSVIFSHVVQRGYEKLSFRLMASSTMR